ncbi:hypothetical protein L195_g008284 [Trifolium pratense]|uniref:Uncharacterized protein n=1 Tax=Trifolium pratense TaxID=57577 RepID=A0A2K3P8R6_TRIPR|nr:hypothetical protein L195_g008284 [Trifolium pratense]
MSCWRRICSILIRRCEISSWSAVYLVKRMLKADAVLQTPLIPAVQEDESYRGQILKHVGIASNDYEFCLAKVDELSSYKPPYCTTSVAICVCCYGVVGIAGMSTCGKLLRKIAPVSSCVFAAVAHNQ